MSNYDGMPQLTPENLDNAKAQIQLEIKDLSPPIMVRQEEWDKSKIEGLEMALEIIEECQTVETE